MAQENYLNQEGFEAFVGYVNDQLDNKANKGDQVVLPNDLVHEADIANFLTENDLSDYAKKSELPAAPDLSGYATVNDLAGFVDESALADYATVAELQDYATAQEVEALRGMVTGVYHYKGTVADLAALQAIQNPEAGDVYNVAATGMNAAWVVDANNQNGGYWDEFGTQVDLSDYALKSDIQAIALNEVQRILYSGSSAAVADRASLNAMIANDEPEVEITLNKNIAVTTPIVIPEGKKVVLDLGGKTLSGQIPIQGTGGEIILKNGTISSTSDAVYLTEGSKCTLDGAVINSNHNGISAWSGSEVVVNSGFITSQECGIAGFKDATVTINGGTITGLDNGPVMGNGSAPGAQNDGSNMNIVMNGGTLIAHIQSAGYIACGVYVPNTGSFTMNGGEIISDGCGLCMRGGQVNLNGGSIIANGTSGIEGKVGDSRVVVGPYAVVYDAQSKYPGVDTLELNIASGMILQGTDGDINVVQSDYPTNINDNRS